MKEAFVDVSYFLDWSEGRKESRTLILSLTGRMVGLLTEMRKGGEDIWEGERTLSFSLVNLDCCYIFVAMSEVR